jgi:hypothetical protein
MAVKSRAAAAITAIGAWWVVACSRMDAGPLVTGADGAGGGSVEVGECQGGSGTGCGRGLVCEHGATKECVDPVWAQWPMSNAQTDVAAGAPNPESYTDNSDGTVTDNVTSLVWQQSVPPGMVTQAEALVYCASLSLAGHMDWRLPSYVELFSIVDPSTSNPSVNGSVFPATPADYSWTSTLHAGSSAYAWAVDFTSGDPLSIVVSSAKYVRCVR